MKHRAYIGLGSNLQNPRTQLNSALQCLNKVHGCVVEACSPFYGSSAIGPGKQPDYINAVARIGCDLEAIELLDHLQKIESDHGRIRGPEQWVPRTLDLDILLFDALTIDSERLQVPHPRMEQRNFVLQPLFDLAPELQLPNGNAVADLLKTTGKEGLWRLKESPAV